MLRKLLDSLRKETTSNQHEVKRMNKHMDLLGRKCVDKVTGMEGVVTSVSFDLYGCVQVVLHPGLKEDGTLRDTLWFDIARLTPLGEPVMERPNFCDASLAAQGKKGPAEKPPMSKA